MKFRNLLRFLLSTFVLIGSAFVSSAAIVTFDSPSNISEEAQKIIELTC